MTPFSSVITFWSGVLESRRLTIFDLRWYNTISLGLSKPFVDFNTATSLWSNLGFVFS
jgi:hypothetical protein